MNIKKSLLEYGKKTIVLGELETILRSDKSDIKRLFDSITELVENGLLEPVKTSGKNGNYKYPLYKKYRIIPDNEKKSEVSEMILKAGLHPDLLKNGYLLSHQEEYIRNRTAIEKLNNYLFSDKSGVPVSRKERSFEIFGCEKILDDNTIKSLLRKLNITEDYLGFYDTP